MVLCVFSFEHSVLQYEQCLHIKMKVGISWYILAAMIKCTYIMHFQNLTQVSFKFHKVFSLTLVTVLLFTTITDMACLLNNTQKTLETTRNHKFILHLRFDLHLQEFNFHISMRAVHSVVCNCCRGVVHVVNKLCQSNSLPGYHIQDCRPRQVGTLDITDKWLKTAVFVTKTLI